MDTLLAKYEEMTDTEEHAYYETAMNFWTQYSQTDDKLMSLAKQGKV